MAFFMRRNASPLCTLLIASAAFLSAPSAWTQAAGTASLSGSVLDPAGATIPGATVTITNTATDFKRAATSDAEGRYSFPNVPVGTYTLSIAAQGFATYVGQNILLQVGNNSTVNAQMQIGAATQEVTVESNAVSLETETVNYKQVVDQTRINELPLNGRQPTQLVLITGGAVTAPSGDMVGSKNYASSTVIAVAGGQGNYNNYVLDGGYHVDEFTNVNLPFPFPDALREFSVESNSLAARNGIHPGALVNAVTVSGTNKWHGTAFEFIRNNIINSTNFFSAAKDTLKRNQFGGTLGGYVVRDKLFFFGGYQGTRNRQVGNATGYCIPTAAELSGDFSKMGGNCTVNVKDGQTLVNPVSGATISTTPGSANYRRVDTSTYSQQALNLMKYLPLSQADQYGYIRIALPANYSEDQYIGRVDYTWSSRHSLFGRYYITNYNAPSYYSPTNLLLTTTAGNDERVQTFTLGDTFNFTPRMINTFHGTYARRRNNRGPTAGGINAQTIGVNVYTYVPVDLRLTVTNGFSVGCGTCSPGFFNVNTEAFSDSVDWELGAHAISFGGEYIRTGNNVLTGYLQNGSYTFNGQLSGAKNGNTGEGMIDFLTGRMQAFGQSRSQQNSFRENIFSLYGQDTWHATQKLTVSYGLRWEPMLYQTDKQGRGSVFDQTAFNNGTHSTVFPNAPAGSLYYGDAGVPKSLTNNRMLNFSPRAGLSYAADDKTVIRMGGAIMYDMPNLFMNQRQITNPPYTNEINITGNIPFADPWSVYPGGSPFPGVFPPDKTATFPTQGQFVILKRNIRTPVIYQWTASVQHDLGQGWSMTMNYLGNRNNFQWLGNYFNHARYIPGTSTGLAGSCGGLTGSNLPASGAACSTTASANANARTPLSLTNPAQGTYYTPTMTLIDDKAYSVYHGGIFTVQHRGTGSFSFLANYTWSKCMSLADNPGDVAATTLQNSDNPRGDYSYCGFDIRHIANVTVVAQSNFKSLHGWTSALVNHWQLAPYLRIMSGATYNVTTGSDRSLTAQANDRPNLVPGANVYSGVKVTSTAATSTAPGNRFYFVGSAYTLNPTGTYGNLPRNSLRGPAYYNMDVALSRIFPIHERLNLQLRLESFNLFNHPYLNSFTTANPTSSTFGYANGAADPRIFQAAAKFNF
jgi:hypothetical protein